MDAPRFAFTIQRKMRTPAVLFLFIITISSITVRAQLSIADPQLDKIKQLSAEEKWVEIVRLAETDAAPSAEVNYYYGLALARLERWSEATKAFRNGLRQMPGDKRFLLELAGVSFKQRKNAEAVEYLRRALRIDPTDPYANDFLASLYFLQGNLEAALTYWNKVSKPQIEEVQIDPALKVDPTLLDHAFAFAPATVLRLSELRTTNARVSGLDIFPTYRFDLAARSDGKFDSVFRARERNGWGNTRWEGFLSLFRGLPFQTIHPEFFNIRHQAINSESLIRWDEQKRRFWTRLTGPFSGEPKWRYRLDLDLRNENWDLHQSSASSSTPLSALNLRKESFTGAVTSLVNGRLNWSSGVEVSHREFRNVSPGALTPELLAQGLQLKHLLQLNYEIVRAPQQRFFVTTGTSTELGRIWSDPSHAFAKLQGSLLGRWFPQPSGDDYETVLGVRAGKTLGEIPFDELFILGVERDNRLWLRAHIGTRDGRKGNAPMGRNYFLANWELDKRVHTNEFFSLKLGPFLDTGKITDPFPGLGSHKWLWDLGAQAKVRVLGAGFVFSYGKDLRSGNNAFYVSMF